jgi:hypothetical protein
MHVELETKLTSFNCVAEDVGRFAWAVTRLELVFAHLDVVTFGDAFSEVSWRNAAVQGDMYGPGDWWNGMSVELFEAVKISGLPLMREAAAVCKMKK